MRYTLLSLLIVSDSVFASPFQACRELWLKWVRDPQHETRIAQSILPDLLKNIAAYEAEKFRQSAADEAQQRPARDAWLAQIRGMPIRGLKMVENSRNGTFHNRTWSATIEGEQVILKRPERRVETDSGRVHAFTGSPEFEVVAYALSHHLGMHVVPAAVVLSDGYVAVQRIPNASSQTVRQATPQSFLDVSHGSIIDHLLINLDRRQEGVLVDANSKVYFYDFDLSMAKTRYSGFVGWLSYPLEGVRVGDRKVNLPWVIARPVLQKLQALDRTVLEQLLARHSVTALPAMVDTILGQRDQVLGSFVRWESDLGLSLTID